MFFLSTLLIYFSSLQDMYLYYFLKQYPGRTLVFTNSKDCIRRLVSVFTLLQCNPLPLHADMHQRQRLKNLEKFSGISSSFSSSCDCHNHHHQSPIIRKPMFRVCDKRPVVQSIVSLTNNVFKRLTLLVMQTVQPNTL